LPPCSCLIPPGLAWGANQDPAAPAQMSKLRAKRSAPDGSPAPSPGSAPLGEFPRGAPASRHCP
jgi:hypothetical protein